MGKVRRREPRLSPRKFAPFAQRRSRGPIVLVLVVVLDRPVFDYENEDDDDDEK